MYEYYPLDPTCVERGTVSEEPNRTALPYDYVLLLGIQDDTCGSSSIQLPSPGEQQKAIELCARQVLRSCAALGRRVPDSQAF